MVDWRRLVLRPRRLLAALGVVLLAMLIASLPGCDGARTATASPERMISIYNVSADAICRSAVSYTVVARLPSGLIQATVRPAAS